MGDFGLSTVISVGIEVARLFELAKDAGLKCQELAFDIEDIFDMLDDFEKDLETVDPTNERVQKVLRKARRAFTASLGECKEVLQQYTKKPPADNQCGAMLKCFSNCFQSVGRAARAEKNIKILENARCRMRDALLNYNVGLTQANVVSKATRIKAKALLGAIQQPEETPAAPAANQVAVERPKCAGFNKRGLPCQRFPATGHAYCHFHNPNIESAVEAASHAPPLALMQQEEQEEEEEMDDGKCVAETRRHARCANSKNLASAYGFCTFHQTLHNEGRRVVVFGQK